MMKVKKICTKTLDLEIKGATLLSVEEAKSLPERLRKYTDWWWWLRSPGYYQDTAAYVNHDGVVYEHGDYVDCDDFGVRPGLNINLDNSNLTIGDKFIFGDKEFEIISDNLAFCVSDIGCCAFRKDYDANYVNKYEHSDIKKYVEDWYSGVVKK